MAQKVLIFDTSVLCCFLQIPGKETCGPIDDRWDFGRIEKLVSMERELNSTFVIPLASIIETGNHISQAGHRRHETALAFSKMLIDIAEARSPWAAFTDQAVLWEPEQLRRLATNWPDLAAGKFSIGDATIKEVAEHYAKGPYDVVIVTGDAQLRAYQPPPPAMVPRRRGG